MLGAQVVGYHLGNGPGRGELHALGDRRRPGVEGAGEHSRKGEQVADASDAEWEAAILAGFDVWRELAEAGAGVVCGDLDHRSLTIRALTDDDRASHAEAATDWLAEQKAKAKAQRHAIDRR